MKKITNYINNSKILFTVFMFIVFIIFLFIINDISLISSKFDSLGSIVNGFFSRIYISTYYGKQMMNELFWLLLLLPVIFIFGNKYIFTQKKLGFFKSMLQVWPVLGIILINLICSSIEVYKAKSFDIYEFSALIVLTFLIGMFEEFLCRGWVQNEFIERFGDTRKNVIFSISVSAFLFGFMHIGNAFIGTQTLTQTLIQIINATIMGLAFGAIYYKNKNIWTVVFLHASWDFALMLSEINISTTCIDLNNAQMDGIIVFLMGLFAITILAIPNIIMIKKFMNKKAINEELPKKNQEKILEKELEEINKKNKNTSIITVIFLVFFAFIQISSSGQKSNINSSKCPVYKNIGIGNVEYSEQYLNYKEYEFKNNLGEYIIKIENDKINIENKTTKENILLNYTNVLNLLVINNNEKYDIYFVHSDENHNLLTYQLKVEDNMNINEFDNKFKLVKLPDIYYLGYYQEKGDNIKYPLFRNNVNDRFVIKNDEIYTYKVN